jgi:membrane-associated phospholipid phosphatase
MSECKERNQRTKLLPTIARFTPGLYIGIVLFNCLINPSYNSYYLLISYIIVILSNYFFKNIVAKTIYNLLNKQTLPIIGSGKRPNCAVSCSLTLDGKVSRSYGMPSGHSQITWAVVTYLICKIIYKWINNSDNNLNTEIKYFSRIILILLLLATGIYVSYSRVYIESCHTLQQVIIGGIIGSIFGFGAFYYEDYFVNLMKKNL